MSSSVVIIGAGHAGGSLAHLLRQSGFSGAISLIGDEAYSPYQRPPLSKAFLKGQASLDSLKLRPDAFYAAHDIALRLGEKVEEIDRANRQVKFASGERLAYDHLVLATGARPRKLDLAGIDAKGVHYLRNITDAQELAAELRPGRKLAILGAGYVGLEAAASARSLGCDVVVVEREKRVLARVASEPLASFVQNDHLGHGVSFRFNAEVGRIRIMQDRVVGLELTNGDFVGCDILLVGVGAQPNDELAQRAGLPCDRGVIVDQAALTSDPNIFAIGDVAVRPALASDRRHLRLESVQNALEQARIVANQLCQRPAAPPEVPWFWSDQFDLKLQMVGVGSGTDDIVVRGDPDTKQFAIFHLKQGRVTVVEAVNSPADFMIGKQLIARQGEVAAERLRDVATPLKALITP